MEKEVIISIKGMQKYENAEPDTIELVTGGRLERDGESFTLSYQESAVTGMDGTLTTFQIEPERVTLPGWGSTPPKWCFRRGGGTCPCTTPLWHHVHRGEHPAFDSPGGRERRRHRDRLCHRDRPHGGGTKCISDQDQGGGTGLQLEAVAWSISIAAPAPAPQGGIDSRPRNQRARDPAAGRPAVGDRPHGGGAKCISDQD